MSVSEKARHIKCEAKVSLIKDSWYCANCNSYVNENDVVVKFKVAQQEIDEHGKNNEALAKVCSNLNDKIERLERERVEQKQKLQQIIGTAKRYAKESMDFAGYDRISEELEELLK